MTPSPSNPTPGGDARLASKPGCISAIALGLLLPSCCLFLAWLAWGLSCWSGALAVGGLLLVPGLFACDRRAKFALWLLSAGIVLVVGPLVARVASVRGSTRIHLTSLPGDTGPGVISRLYPEADGAIAAAGLLRLVGPGLNDQEAARFQQILKHAYAGSELAAAGLPTPAIATYLGLQRPSRFDTIVIQPPASEHAPNAAIIFLHGYAGNFYVYCWELAQAAASANLVTLCPSTDASGAWWTERGDETFQATLEYARRIGMNRIYVAGLSNGAAGASVLALEHQSKLSGLVLISGVRAELAPSFPVLLVQGSSDRMMPAASASAYAARNPQARYHELSGGHLILLSESTKVRAIIAEFLAELELHSAPVIATLGIAAGKPSVSSTGEPAGETEKLKWQLRNELKNADLADTSLVDADLRGVNGVGANFRHADLTRSVLFGPDVSDARLEGANLRAARLNGANFSNANLAGADLRGALYTGTRHGYPTRFPQGFHPEQNGMIECPGAQQCSQPVGDVGRGAAH